MGLYQFQKNRLVGKKRCYLSKVTFIVPFFLPHLRVIHQANHPPYPSISPSAARFWRRRRLLLLLLLLTQIDIDRFLADDDAARKNANGLLGFPWSGGVVVAKWHSPFKAALHLLPFLFPYFIFQCAISYLICASISGQ